MGVVTSGNRKLIGQSLSRDYLELRVAWLSDSRVTKWLSLDFTPRLPETQVWFEQATLDSNRGDYIYFLEGDKNEVVGMAGLTGISTSPTNLFLSYIYVNPDMHGEGLGRAILSKVEFQAVVLGASYISLETHVQNTAAISLYESSGYSRVEKPLMTNNKIAFQKPLESRQ